MNRILFQAQKVTMPSWKKAAGRFIRKVLRILGHDNWELSVLFCNNSYIKSLNAKYRDKDEPTDILSFPLGELVPSGEEQIYMAGDIVISLDALAENARFFKVSPDEELRRLLVHGILHLAGSDHASNKKEEPMLKTQEEILTALAGERVCGQENDQ